MIYTIGTRGSKLALAQAQMVADRLQEAYPKDTFLLRIVHTQGDKDVHTPLDKMKDKGIFVKEIEQLLLRKEIAIAVHSMKDMPSTLPDGLCFAKAWKGEDARDVWVARESKPIDRLSQNAVIATGSKRRIALLHACYPKVSTIGIRGNIDTRIKKMHAEGYDGLILAAAGLKRLARADEITSYLDPTRFIPACTQGILAIELACANTELKKKIDRLADEKTNLRVLAERAFLKGVDGGCHIAVGAYLDVQETDCTLYALLGDETGGQIFTAQKKGRHEDVEELGKQLAVELLKKREEAHG